MIPGKTATVAEYFKHFLSSRHYSTIDVEVFIIFLHVSVSTVQLLLQNRDKHQNGTQTGQEETKRETWQLP